MEETNPVLDAQAEIERIQGKITQEVPDKPKKARKEPNWMDKYRGRRYLRRSWEYLAEKWTISRANWLNLAGFVVFFTNILSIFTVLMLAAAMYYTLTHLKNRESFTLIIAGAVLIVAIGWINSRIGSGEQNEKDIPQ